MAQQKMFVFDPQDLVNLLVHYSDGMIPLDHTVGNVGFNPMLQRFIGIEILSEDWEDQEPLHLRYEGKKVMSWSAAQKSDHPEWAQRNDTPVRQ